VDLAAATATSGDPTLGKLILAAAGLLWLAGYVAACAIWPYTKCGRCKGKGRHPSPTGKAWRTCRRCKGSGARIRRGRHVWNALRAKSSDT
jgi:hypothetical protein